MGEELSIILPAMAWEGAGDAADAWVGAPADRRGVHKGIGGWGDRGAKALGWLRVRKSGAPGVGGRGLTRWGLGA